MLETTVAVVLRAGVGLAAALVAAGGAVYLWRHGAEPPAFDVFRPGAPWHQAAGGWRDAAGGIHGRPLIHAGVLVLVVTPLARVALSLVAFVRERDRRLAGITLLVLALLIASLLSGLR
jgi:uncharacterized membrane protein